jgi:hypothetical protein
VPFDQVTNGGDVATGVVEDAAGRLVVVGASVVDGTNFYTRSFALRLMSDGSLDQSFGTFGKKVYNFDGDSDLATGVALQGTQAIMAGLTTSGSDTDNFVARLEVDLIFAGGFD